MSDILHVASRKGLFRYQRVSDGWSAGPPAFLGEPVSAVLADPRDGALYAALRLGHFGIKLHRSDDAGRSWTQVAAPAFPVAAEGAEAAPTVDMIWTLAAGGADEPGVLWAGTLPGAVFMSRDRGDSWTLNQALWDRPERAAWFGGGYDLSGVHSILADPRDSRAITLGISCGGVWRTEDGGMSWIQGGHGLRNAYMPPGQAQDPVNQDPHRLAASAADPDVIWCQHHNGVFLSRDRGHTFTEVETARPSAFGFAVVAHPADPSTAWFVPAVKDEYRVPVDARLVVSRTHDGGETFEVFGEGLPEVSYDLVYRHALDIDAAGTRLAMGSTTGNLWVSDDGGRGWACVSTHLPPIAQVAFG